VIREVFSPQLERWLGPAIADAIADAPVDAKAADTVAVTPTDDRLQQVSRVAANGP
jgi:hypothetical protein